MIERVDGDRAGSRVLDRTAGNGEDSQVVRGLRTLEALAEQPMNASEVARLTGVNRSTSLRLLQDLESAGYVLRDRQTKRYSTVAARFYALAASHHDDSDWTAGLMPVLEEARDEFGEAAILGVPAGGNMVYLAFLPSRHPIAVRERLGTVRPKHASALGKAFMSMLEPSKLDGVLARLSYQGGTERAAKGPLELRERIEAIRELGYAVDADETFEGVTCVAAPVRVGRAPLGAVGVSGPSARLDPARCVEIGERLGAKLAAFSVQT